MAQLKTTLTLLFLLNSIPGYAEGRFPPEVEDPASAEAFKQYWNAFESYEQAQIKAGEKKFQESRDQIKQSYNQELKKITADELNALQKSATKYRKHLEEHSLAESRPYVMLNLAQVLGLIGDQLKRNDNSGGSGARTEALGLLRDIEDQFPAFPYREQAGYLRAAILESLDKQDDALAAWRTLAALNKASLYTIHARIAVGDHMWRRERAAEALRSYESALALIPDLETGDPEYERLRINYRIAWAASRAGEVNKVVKSTVELLTPGRRIKSLDQRIKIQNDAVELMGDALFENNVIPRTREILSRRDISTYAAAIGLRTISKYNATNAFDEAAEVGEFVIKTYPLAAEIPKVIQVTADSLQKLGKTPRRLAFIEQLAMLYPKQSLWRSRHKDEPAIVREMEALARPAAILAASSHYDTGLAAGNAKAFESAASYYELLLEVEPNGSESNGWRLRLAHCRYFGGKYNEASKLYSSLKSEYKVDSETLQVASYQLVLANERRWRDAFGKATEKSENPAKDARTLESLKDLEKSIDEFAARFPSQTRSVDLLLVGASANRDMERFESASNYWQRSLVSQPTAAQRGIAIRGMIFANMKTGSAGDVVELVRKFLKLEDWRNLGINLGNELRGVLSVAALDESKRLNDSGKVLEAGTLLTQIAAEFSELPDRDRIYRDGAYMLAIASDWAGAQRAAEGYFKAGLLKNRADMTYLLARSHEYQIRLHDAAVKYQELGEKYPSHPKAATSLARAEKLALAEGDYALATQAAATQAEQAKREPDRLAHYARAVEYLEKTNSPDKALSLARKRLRSSQSLGERIRSRILVARTTFASGSEQEALDELQVLAKEVDRSRSRLEPEEYASLAGEINFQLAEEARRKFDDFRIVERAGGVGKNLAEKTQYFDDLVTGYDKAAAAGDPKWAARARFQLATAAASFADEIAGIQAKSSENPSLRSQNRYKTTIERLQAMSKKYFSTNILAAKKDPEKYKGNEWVERSAHHLSGDTSTQTEGQHNEVMPTAVQDNVPMQWSM